MTPDHRVTAVRRDADRRLEVDLWNDYTKTTTRDRSTRSSSSTGRRPNDELFFDLAAASRNGGELDVDAYLAGRPQERVVNADGTYQLFRLGDAVASRNIHAAIYEARRIAMVL